MIAALQKQKLGSNIDPKGVLVAMTIILSWFSSLIFWLHFPVVFSNPVVYVGVLLQTHLYTGLFITAHDAMHGVVSSNKKLNHALGWLAALLFSYNFYWRLFPEHHKHHRHVATAEDPDYHVSNRFLPWYLKFIFHYVNIWQVILMAVTYNLLKLVFPVSNLIVFWMLPAVLSTLQLFYFGTYLPHKGSHDNKHHSGTMAANHFWAFLSCYFFGYHLEHHEAPNTPWWRLWKTKKEI
ncbi:beta-carotene ketolase (CrtW type) [Cyclobacterium lianum]|uniref:Beta-carotene ketolase (CrtW type) n=1 Tax=Cyclobacterium lianum TaxID=388280 RepID=A0A1M7IJR5_9BACT|nr:fatty acid desaturase [Cyclobacterium lianum]SHM40637.1 beta-carotene ketolase (CrtW type) [Cyclobacterium lianum]